MKCHSSHLPTNKQLFLQNMRVYKTIRQRSIPVIYFQLAGPNQSLTRQGTREDANKNDTSVTCEADATDKEKMFKIWRLRTDKYFRMNIYSLIILTYW